MTVSQNHILGRAGGRFCDLNIAGLKIFAVRLAKRAIFSALMFTYSKTVYKQNIKSKGFEPELQQLQSIPSLFRILQFFRQFFIGFVQVLPG